MNRQSYERMGGQTQQQYGMSNNSNNNNNVLDGKQFIDNNNIGKSNYMINIIGENQQGQGAIPNILQTAQSEFDPKLELMFNRIQYFQQQVINYDNQNTSLKDQMDMEIERNKRVEDSVNETLADVNQDLNNLNSVVESIAEKKAFLDKAINQIKLVRLIQMENEFLKNENKQLKNKMDDLYQVIRDFQESETELLRVQENLKKDMKDIIQTNQFIKNNYSANQATNTQVEQQLLLLQTQHKKLLADYEIIEKENIKLKSKDSRNDLYIMSQRNSQVNSNNNKMDYSLNKNDSFINSNNNKIDNSFHRNDNSILKIDSSNNDKDNNLLQKHQLNDDSILNIINSQI